MVIPTLPLDLPCPRRASRSWTRHRARAVARPWPPTYLGRGVVPARQSRRAEVEEARLDANRRPSYRLGVLKNIFTPPPFRTRSASSIRTSDLGGVSLVTGRHGVVVAPDDCDER